MPFLILILNTVQSLRQVYDLEMRNKTPIPKEYIEMLILSLRAHGILNGPLDHL